MNCFWLLVVGVRNYCQHLRAAQLSAPGQPEVLQCTRTRNVRRWWLQVCKGENAMYIIKYMTIFVCWIGAYETVRALYRRCVEQNCSLFDRCVRRLVASCSSLQLMQLLVPFISTFFLLFFRLIVSGCRNNWHLHRRVIHVNMINFQNDRTEILVRGIGTSDVGFWFDQHYEFHNLNVILLMTCEISFDRILSHKISSHMALCQTK